MHSGYTALQGVPVEKGGAEQEDFLVAGLSWHKKSKSEEQCLGATGHFFYLVLYSRSTLLDSDVSVF